MPEPWRRAAQYLAPDTPAKVLPTGDLWLRSRLTNYQTGEIRDFMNSKNPGKRGRRRKSDATLSRAPSKGPVEREALAALAYKNEQNGVDWKETARVACPDLNLYDKRQREAARQRVRRLIFNGEDLALQKMQTPPPQKKSDG
jgi:hypothetical protein